MKKPRRQCMKCPWKTSTNPHDIPHGYCPAKHAALAGTIADPSSPDLSILATGKIRMMACHESKPRREIPCVGWLAHQLGPGNNIGLRLLAHAGKLDTNFELVGPQHARFEDTLPEELR